MGTENKARALSRAPWLDDDTRRLLGEESTVHEAARRSVFAYIVDGSPEELHSAIDITLQRFAEYHSL